MLANPPMTLRNTRQLTFLDVEMSRVDQARGAYDDIAAGRIVGVILRGAFDPALLARGATRLIADERIPHLSYESGGPVMTQIYGCPTQLADGDLDAHYRKADLCTTAIREAFGPDFDFEARLCTILSAIADHRPAGRLPHPSGRSPAIGAVNRHEPGGCTPHHFDLVFFESPQFRALRPYLDGELLINLNFPLECATAGGDLEFFAYDWPAFQSDFPGAGREQLTERFHPEQFESRRIPLAVGDIVIFDAGRICHSVTTVEGSKRRMHYGAHTSFAPGRASIVYFT